MRTRKRGPSRFPKDSRPCLRVHPTQRYRLRGWPICRLIPVNPEVALSLTVAQWISAGVVLTGLIVLTQPSRFVPALESRARWVVHQCFFNRVQFQVFTPLMFVLLSGQPLPANGGR